MCFREDFIFNNLCQRQVIFLTIHPYFKYCPLFVCATYLLSGVLHLVSITCSKEYLIPSSREWKGYIYSLAGKATSRLTFDLKISIPLRRIFYSFSGEAQRGAQPFLLCAL